MKCHCDEAEQLRDQLARIDALEEKLRLVQEALSVMYASTAPTIRWLNAQIHDVDRDAARQREERRQLNTEGQGR